MFLSCVSLGIGRSTTVGNPSPALCIVSTESLNQYFKATGYHEQLWSYGGPVSVNANSSGEAICVQQLGDHIYTISENGIKAIARPRGGTYYMGDKAGEWLWCNANESRSMEFSSGLIMPQNENEVNPVVDSSLRYLGRRFESQGKERFASYEIYLVEESSRILLHGDGLLVFLRSKGNQIMLVKRINRAGYWMFEKYEIDHDTPKLVYNQEIRRPEGIPGDWIFGFEDYDSVKAKLVFLSDSFTSRFFRNRQMHVYDLASGNFVYSRKLKNANGNLYARFLAEPLAAKIGYIQPLP